MKAKLLSYIKKRFSPKEPIFYEDLQNLGIKATALRVTLKRLADSGALTRVARGVYCLPKVSQISNKKIPSAVEDVLIKKYIADGEGYFSGFNYANSIGATSQVPMTFEIRTNKATTAYREIEVLKRRVFIRKPRVQVTKENAKILQLLDFLTDVKTLSEWTNEQLKEVTANLVKKENMSRAMLRDLMRNYPDCLYRNIVEMEVFKDEVFA